ETKFGTTYNSYFINAEKKVVIETVKERFWDVYREKLSRLTDPAAIDYIIMDHTEPDHSGCVAKLLEIAPKAKVVGSGNAIRYLKDLLGFEFPHLIIKDGQTLDLGNKSLKFIGAPNLHWPDSIMTYLAEDKILFTCDIFGEHFCNEAMFDDAVPDFSNAFRYYFDVIMKPYSRFMLQAIERMRPLDIHMIAPGHGMILRQDWKKWVDITVKYSEEYLKNPSRYKVFLAYVSAYHNTGLIAEKIAEGIRSAGNIDVDLCDIENMELSLIEQKLVQSSGIMIGCPTFSQNILLPVYQMFAVINPIRDRGKLAAVFGSYGWSGEGAKIMSSALTNLKLNVMDEGLMIKFTPHADTLKRCFDYGRTYGERFLSL
ncbi:MAG: FprA family A-type flavoprotein, partial [Bacteroidota bacterium]